MHNGNFGETQAVSVFVMGRADASLRLCMLLLVYIVTSPFQDICPRFKVAVHRVKKAEPCKKDSCLTSFYTRLLFYAIGHL